MSKKNNPQKEIDLKDFIWEEEEFDFQPKVNRHRKFLKAKKRQLQKEAYAQKKYINKVNSAEHILDEHGRYISKIEQSLLQDYYDIEDEDEFTGYRIK